MQGFARWQFAALIIRNDWDVRVLAVLQFEYSSNPRSDCHLGILEAALVKDVVDGTKEVFLRGDLHAEVKGPDKGQIQERPDVVLTDCWKMRRYRGDLSLGRSGKHGCARVGPAMQQALLQEKNLLEPGGRLSRRWAKSARAMIYIIK